MLHFIDQNSAPRFGPLLDSMFRDRKTVFVDFLKWSLQCDGDQERDQFDNGDACYLVVEDKETGRHKASVRLLPTMAPHLLADVFPQLCAEAPLRDPGVFEITRLCQDPKLRGDEARAARLILTNALVEFALVRGIKSYVGVTPIDFLSRLLVTGWRCSTLGLPLPDGNTQIAAFRIDVDEHTQEMMEKAGNYLPSGLRADEVGLAKAA
jgi:N-acyl-L-homoserine lactone synthetase